MNAFLVVAAVVAAVVIVIVISNRLNKPKNGAPVSPSTDDSSGDKPYNNGTRK